MHLPTPKEIQQFRYVHLFGDLLKRHELWAFNRTGIAKGIAIGIFCAFLPMPFEMLPAIFIATVIGGNIPFAVAGVWISNPITWIPLYTPCYLLGARIIGVTPIPIEEITILQLGWHYVALWLGCLIVGSVLSLTTHFVISYAWTSQVRKRWRRRQLLRMRAKKQTANNSLD